MDIADWLRGLGLSQYAAVFCDNAIDLETLPELTEPDLEKLGVLLGHRKRVLRAAAALGAAEPPPAARPESREAAAERRQLTVMFVDLVGSTRLSSHMDPEDLRDVISAYHQSVAQTVDRLGGFVAKYMGDGVLVYFGYPQAHEDDAERAVRAGLAVIDAVGRLAAPEPLKVRLGIATGLAVVGDLIGSGAAQERGVVGETPNLAARLQALAAPDSLVVSQSTRRQIGGLFEIEDLGLQSLAGFAASQRAWRVIRESGVLSRFEALRAAALTPLVGREEEIELLLRRWRRAAEGEGQTVLVCGEPGIGKSRLAAALRDRLGGEELTRLRYFCSPHHQESALYPLIAQLERAALFAHDDPVDLRLDKLEALLSPTSPPPEEVGLFAQLLSLPSRYSLPPSTPQRRRERTFAALMRQLEALARQKPILMVFEDLHWIDPSSREFLDRTIEGIVGLPVLLVATFRPEFAPPWSGLPQVTALTLARLDRRTGAAIVASIAGNAVLSSEAAAEIVERADGVPLFVEELTRAVVEAGGESEGIASTLACVVSPLAAVPAALHAPLMARLDRLGQEAKEISQIAAAIGREFSYGLLAPVAGRGEEELLGTLARLGDAGLVFSRGTPPHATFLFKHALVRDAAYASLLRRRREQLHARIAAVLEADFADRVAAEPELLAQHLTEAGLLEKAVSWWQRAGERATERSANLEAIAQLKRGLEILGQLPESRERDEQELLLQAALIGPLMANEGAGTAGIDRAASRVIELEGSIAQISPAKPLTVRARIGLGGVRMMRGELRSGLALAEETLALAERLGHPLVLSQTYYLMGMLEYHLGDLAAARRHLEEGLAIYDPARHRARAARYGLDSCVACHAYLSIVLWLQGFPVAALCHAEEAVAAAHAAAHPFSEALALHHAAIVRHQLRGEVALCLERAEEGITLATEQVFPLFAAYARVYGGWALVKAGQEPEGFTLLHAGLDSYRALDIRVYRPPFLALFAEACLSTSRLEGGLSAVREALAEVEGTEARWYEAELRRLQGELFLASGEPDESGAEAAFGKAVGIAREQGAKSWELRATTSLARLLERQGKREKARALSRSRIRLVHRRLRHRRPQSRKGSPRRP
jgi:class 3 adenylate cyclase